MGLLALFGVKLFIDKELSGENAMFDFMRFLRFFARFLQKHRQECLGKCTFYSILCTLGF